MRKILLLVILFLFSIQGFSQFGMNIDFESQVVNNQYIEIDRISNPDNVWQIGVPNKPVFDAAHSPTRALITDINTSYLVNDTSSFILKQPRNESDFHLGGGNIGLYLAFWFKMNSDTLTDYGKIEVSVDHGLSWIDVMTEDETYGFYWMEGKPVLSGNSNGWQRFFVDLHELTYAFEFCDTLLYRFSFISDGVQTNKDGWMIDDFYMDDMYEGIEDFGNSDFITLYPNPAANEVSVAADNISLQRAEIIDFTGKTVVGKPMETGALKFDLPNGMYVLKLFDGCKIYVKKLLVAK